ncbi:MAG: hypothetical protein ACRDPB_04935, partial [Nocardioidaceae bacterium]
MASGRYRYSPWSGGPDPLAPPYDVRAALDEIGRDVLAGASMREAMRELLRRGMTGPDGRMPGLDDLAARIQRMRKAARRRGDLGGTLDKVSAALDQALAEERHTLAGEDGDDARWAEMELDTLPEDTAGAIRALDDYQWHSQQARATFESIKQMLRREVLDAQFAGLAQALDSADPDAMQRVKDMLADLNALLAAHARGEDTTDAFRDFMDKHGDLFPENPQNVDELIDALARRQAAADRLMASLSPEQREQLGQLMSQALSDPDLASQMAQLSDNLRALRPGMARGPVGMRPGGEQLGYSDAVQAVAELAELDALGQAVDSAMQGGSLDDVDVEALEQHLGGAALADFRALRELERELERQGYVDRAGDSVRLTPRALRRLGETALRRVFAQLEARAGGDHADPRVGSADEPTGLTRPWVFGDELALDTVRTVSNAVRRRAIADSSAITPRAEPPQPQTSRGGGVGLLVDDFEVVETERRTSAAVALCVDLSYSMVREGRWGPMKQTALALSHLVATRFRQDALEIIGFNLTARRMSPVALADVEPEWVQGTNLQHALLIAGRHLRRHPESEPVVLVVTDGEPTAHLLDDGTPYFDWPTTRETLRATVGEVDRLARY